MLMITVVIAACFALLFSSMVLKHLKDAVHVHMGAYLLSIGGLVVTLLVLAYVAQYDAVQRVGNGEYCYVVNEEKVVEPIFSSNTCEYLSTRKP